MSALRLRAAMDALYRLCVVVSGAALVLISAVIPWGVFTRYVLNSAASWPEPMAILLTIVLTFFGAAACYRAGAHWIGTPLEAVMLQGSSGVSKFAMLTIPFFVLAGAIMAEGGMARRLVAFADVLVGFTRVRGGLSIVNVLATTFLSGISGSAVADTSAIGSVMIPQMEKA